MSPVNSIENPKKLPILKHKESYINLGCLNCGEQHSLPFSVVEEKILPESDIKKILQRDPKNKIAGSARVSSVKCVCGGDLTIAVGGEDDASNIEIHLN